MRVVHGDFNALTGRICVFLEGEAVILMQDRFAEFAAVRLGDLDFPGRHWGIVSKQSAWLSLVAVAIPLGAFSENFLRHVRRDLGVVTEFLRVPSAAARERTHDRAVMV
jgi:hypothetical protein